MVAALGAAAILLLIVFLVTKELATASDGPRLKTLSRYVGVGIVPLIMVFGMTLFAKIMEVLP